MPMDNKSGTKVHLVLDSTRQKVILFAVVAALVVCLALLLGRTFRRTMYSERQQMLSMVTTSAARNFSRAIGAEWDIYNLSYSIVSKTIHESHSLAECISDVNIQHDFGTDYYFFVDENGNYYSSDGVSGKLDDFSNYLKTSPDRVNYLATLPHLDPRKRFMIYRGRFDEVMRLRTDFGEKIIVFFAYAQDLTEFKNSIGGIFRDESNVFIFDSNGAILYEEYGMQTLLEGGNIRRKLDRCTKPFSESTEEILHGCREGANVVAAVRTDGEDYYFCAAPLGISDWTISILIPPHQIDEAMTGGIWVLILYSLAILLVISAALVLLTYSARIRNQEERLEESRQMVAAIEETSRAKTVFLSNMSHDIRTPINGIMGVSAIARSCVDNPEKVSECLDKIDGASNHLLSLINDVLDMSRIESGKIHIALEPADMTEICESCSSIIRGQIAERNLRFTTEFELSHPKVLADEVHLKRILINILGNAVKFTRDGGGILFRCKETACTDEQITCRFEIKDSGIGMSRQFLGQIFEAFSQEENRERTRYKGTGLGMAITKQLVDLMGGAIEVESEVNKGSQFYVTLSFSRNPEEQAQAVEQEETVADISGVRILLVEDNELNMEIAATLLEASGAVVDRAWDGLEAIDRFTSRDIGSYDVILMDVMMPRMNGYEATRSIRALAREDAARIPIIAMTANAFDEDIRASREAGMNAHLSKPIDMDSVMRTISSFVHKV